MNYVLTPFEAYLLENFSELFEVNKEKTQTEEENQERIKG